MHREGHVGSALLAYAPLGAVMLALRFETYALLGVVWRSGWRCSRTKRVPGVRHRGPTHTVWFALGMLTIGSHILADALTPAGGFEMVSAIY